MQTVELVSELVILELHPALLALWDALNWEVRQMLTLGEIEESHTVGAHARWLHPLRHQF